MTEQLSPQPNNNMESADALKAAIRAAGAPHEPVNEQASGEPSRYQAEQPVQEAESAPAQTETTPVVAPQKSKKLRTAIATVVASAVAVTGGALLLESRQGSDESAAATRKPAASSTPSPGQSTPSASETPQSTESTPAATGESIILEPGLRLIPPSDEASIRQSQETVTGFFDWISSDLKAETFLPLMEHSQKFNGAYVDQQLANQITQKYPAMADAIKPYANSNLGAGLHTFTNDGFDIYKRPVDIANRMATDAQVYSQRLYLVTPEAKADINPLPVINEADLSTGDLTGLVRKMSPTPPNYAIDAIAREAAAGNTEPALVKTFDELQHVGRIDDGVYVPLDILKTVRKIAAANPQDYYEALQTSNILYSKPGEEANYKIDTKLLAVGDINLNQMGAASDAAEMTVATFYQQVSPPDSEPYGMLIAEAFPKALVTKGDAEPIRLATLRLQ